LGIIQKQALRSTLINFVGIGFGAVTRLIMPFVFEKAQIGVIALLDSISGVFVVTLNFGYNLILKKLFPKYRDDENGHHGFLALGIILSIFGALIGISLFYVFKDDYFGTKINENQLIKPFIFLIPLILFFRLIFMNLDGYVRMLFKTVIGSFLEGFVSKIIFFIAIILYVYTLIDFDYFIYMYALALVFPGLFTLFYVFFITKKIKLPSTELMAERKVIKSYVLFGILTGATGAILQYIDVLMIEKLIPLHPEAEVGVYSVFFFAAALIMIPHRNVAKISQVIIAESWKDNDKENIQKLYQKSALNMLIIGGFLLIIGWACLDSVLEFKKLQPYAYAKNVFFILGLGRLIELSTGLNAEIIDASEKYKFNTYFNVILAILAITFNLIFIPAYGIIGAGIATFLALTIINIFRGVFLYKTYNLIPFNKNFFKAAFVVLIFIIVASLLQYNLNPVIEIIINFSVISVLYWFIVIRLNLSSDINNWLLKMKHKFSSNNG
jgi:O-antigen/teichoic acid export membrane protein